jgi:3-oxoacyl-[acyl-carrier-protein] synthase-1
MLHLGMSIRQAGLVTSVGQTAASTCAAIRAKVSNPSETRYAHRDGDWIMAHQVALPAPLAGVQRLAQMAAMAAQSSLSAVPHERWADIPMLLCVAEPSRPGRMAGLEAQLVPELCQLLKTRFAPSSSVVAHGRVSVVAAMAQAHKLIFERHASQVLIVAVDSLLTWPCLSDYMAQGRLLGPHNTNGFMPGEAAGAVLVSAADASSDLACTGMGFGLEPAHIDSGELLRGEGLAQAIKAGLAQAGLGLHELAFRVTDLSGEQYYFKEATLALLRTMRQRRETFDLWHPAECIGEVGAAAGLAALIVAAHATHKGYAPGPQLLLHAGNDAGQRAALVLQGRRAA